MAEDQIIFEKNSALSLEARTSANQLYSQDRHDEESSHTEILLRYSKSIAFAKTADELALGYANRSALLQHLSEHERCLSDIARALKISDSAELTSKLKSRREKCIEAMSKQTTKEASPSKKLPKFRPSAEIPSASEAITVKHDEVFGRHLVATRDIRPGEVIIAERGYVCFPNLAKIHLVCSHCLSFAWNAIPCDACAFAMYCSETCKKDAWMDYHDVECTLLQTVDLPLREEGDWLPPLLIATRLLIKAVKSEGFDAVFVEFSRANRENSMGIDELTVEGQLRSDSFRSCINLLSSQYIDDIKFYESMIPYLAEALYRRTSLFNLKECKIDEVEKTISQLTVVLKKLTGIVNRNGFVYQAFVCECDNQMECRCATRHGNVLAPFGSLINHNCIPNVRRMCLPSGKLAMFTVAPVKKGEQLYGSYGTVYPEDKDYRQDLLQVYFDFTCKCQACEENWPPDRDSIEITTCETMTCTMMKEEFYKYFPSVTKSSVMKESKDWEFNEETLKHAAKLSELTYKYFSDAMLAALHNENYGNYIFKAFYQLYGEKFSIPDKCT